MNAKPQLALLITLALLHAGTFGAARLGWAISDLVQVPRTDLPVTGPPPYTCLSDEERAAQEQNLAYQLSVRLARWLMENLDQTTQLQTHDNCAPTCAEIPLGANAITGLQGFVRPLPDGPFALNAVWPTASSYAAWEPEVDMSRVEGDVRLVCGVLHNWTAAWGYEGYFVVYYEY